MSIYADILLPCPLPQHIEFLTYLIGEDQSLVDLREGDAVAVPMGHYTDRYYTGIVWRLHDEKPAAGKIKSIIKKLYGGELVSRKQRQFWEWLSEYYLSTMGDVMRVALPALIKPSAVDEESFLAAEYTPAEEFYIAPKGREELIEAHRKIPESQHKLRSALQQIIDVSESLRTERGEIPRRVVSCDMAQLNSLVNRGLIELHKRNASNQISGVSSFELPQLSAMQSEALLSIEEQHKSKLCVLLHGVTGSGKTEVYTHLIAKQLAAGRDVMMLVPEIALTTQLIERLTLIFGACVTPYHSKISPLRRTETFMQLTRREEGGAGQFIVGARSAIFLPLNRLGLIIIDEEHDSSYKQNDPAPLYNARDAAHILAALYGAKLLLGSATPSLESWTNATTGKFGMAQLTERFNNASMPRITISDSMRAGKRRERRGHFNMDLIQAIEERLNRGEQTMLFQNRRGFAPYVECPECGWVAQCPNCNVSLTMHKTGNSLVCHYCSHATPIPPRCPNCKATELQPRGFGTQKIEEQVSEIFPSARTLRLDRDSASSQSSFNRIVGSFARRESDILVGTQMIAKGFDFSHVTLVGVLNADNMLNNPDFRAEERAFSLMLQVAGRAGRREGSDAEVIIQSTQPDHRIMQFVKENDYESMARTLLMEREAFFYPPYSRLIMITLKHTDKQRLRAGANALGILLRQRFGARLKGPVAPPVDRVGRVWIMGFMLKIESGASSKRAREIIREARSIWQQNKEFGTINIVFNVDPQ